MVILMVFYIEGCSNAVREGTRSSRVTGLKRQVCVAGGYVKCDPVGRNGDTRIRPIPSREKHMHDEQAF